MFSGLLETIHCLTAPSTVIRHPVLLHLSHSQSPIGSSINESAAPELQPPHRPRNAEAQSSVANVAWRSKYLKKFPKGKAPFDEVSSKVAIILKE